MPWETQCFQWKYGKFPQAHGANITRKPNLHGYGFPLAILLDYAAMLRKIWLGFFLFAAVQGLEADEFDGLNQAQGVNLSLEETFGARPAGMAISFAGFQRDADAVANAPASMNDIDDFTFSTAHAEKFGSAKFDNFAFLFPFQANSTLGLGISRYGVSGIGFFPEGSSVQQSQPTELFSIADYLMVAAFARRWGGLDLGLNFNLLYRQLDQDGIGMRGDAMAQYTWGGWLRAVALIKGLVPSSSSWESGYMEYEPSDLYLGAAARFPTPYFYGSLQVAAQTEGLLQDQAKSLKSLQGSRIYNDPKEILATLNLGLEYLFDFGLACRFGVNEFALSKSISSLTTFGIGYAWRKTVGVDYSFTPHPDLLSTHRVSLVLTPVFPKFNGRNFRQKLLPATLMPEASNVKSIPTEEVEKPKPSDEKEILEEVEEEENP
jgi:hypothetical protein